MERQSHISNRTGVLYVRIYEENSFEWIIEDAGGNRKLNECQRNLTDISGDREKFACNW
jgi:hypothetical protein